MALRSVVRFSRAAALPAPPLTHALSCAAANTASHRGQHGGSGGNHRSRGGGWGHLLGVGAASGAAAVAIAAALPDLSVEAESDTMQDVIDKENRVRQFSTVDTIFDYFATFQKQGYSHGSTLDSKSILMSVRDFYNAVTPGSTITHGTGRGVYTQVDEKDIRLLYDNEHLPIPGGILNEIQKEGMLTYTDFCFLLHILSTPRRYMDIAFHAFDVSADGNVEAKEFAHVIAMIANYKGSRSEMLEDTTSGLMTYLFGKDRKKEITKEDFLKLQRDLINDVLWMEFTRYSKDGKTISEVDFVTHLLANANMPKKKKKQMVKRVKAMVGSDGTGVTYEGFKSFYHVLFGGCDLERAMFFLDTEKNGINSEEFLNIARWVANMEIDPYIVKLIYELLDDDGDKNLSIKEFRPVLFQWRHSRGFQHSSLQVSLGQLRI